MQSVVSLALACAMSLAMIGCGGSSSPRAAGPDSGVGSSADCSTPQIWFLDLDGDNFGDDSMTATACQAPPGYVSQGGDCNDLDPLRHPGTVGDPGFVLDRCGKGQVLEPMSSATGWTPFTSAPQGGSGTMTEEKGGCTNAGLGFAYHLPDAATCGSVSCSWVVMRKTLAAPVDLHDQDYLLFPFHGDAADPSFQVDLKLEGKNGCRLAWLFKSATDLPVRRTAVVPLRWFSTPGPGKPCTVDLSAVAAIEIGVYGESPAAGSFAQPAGVLHLDAITAAKSSDLRMSPTSLACTGYDFGVGSRIAADLLKRHQDSMANRGHPFVASWFEETPSHYYTYNQALLLITFTLEAALAGSKDAQTAATAVADSLVALQRQVTDGLGRWYDLYVDNPDGPGVVPSGDTGFSWFGNTAWVVIALDLYRDVFLPATRQPYDDAIGLAADWLEGKIAAFQAAGNAAGAITDGTEGNVSTFFALVAAEHFTAAGEMKKYLLASPWKADEQRFWMGVQDPGLAIDVIGNWGAEFLHAVGEDSKALLGLGLAAGIFPVKSFDGKHVGLGDIAGPWQPTVEFTGQYIAAGGAGSLDLLQELLTLETAGTFPGSPDDFAGGSGWNTKWHGIAPAAWVYLAVAPDILARLSLPVSSDDFEADNGWGLSEELETPHPECYGTGLGEVVRSTGVAATGTSSLRVTANKGRGSGKSDHVVAEKKIFTTAQSGTLRLEADVYLPNDPTSAGQTGPGLSLQNTRQNLPGSLSTRKAGIQYVANPADPNAGTWGIWAETAPGVAAWQYAPGLAKSLDRGVWYHVRLIANFDTNRYDRLLISTGNTLKTFNLSAYRIAAEPAKSTEEAFWVTAEAENMGNDCGAAAPTEYRVYYDNIVVRR